MTEAVARIPGAWRVVQGPTRRFFEGAAAGWDERVQPDSEEHLAPLVDAVSGLSADPSRILDVGTGTGAAAFWLARRFVDGSVVGVDVSPSMIEHASARVPDELRSRVAFAVADTHAASREGPFDLVVHLNCPVLFADVATALADGGTVVVAASFGARTPFYTSRGALRRGFRRVGLEVTAEGTAGAGTWLAAARPSSP